MTPLTHVNPPPPPPKKKAHIGVKGFVRDAATGAPVPSAVISVDGVEHSVVATDGGAYWRLLLPGDHTLVVSADGYDERRVDVAVGTIGTRPAAQRVDIELYRAGTSPDGGDSSDGGDEEDEPIDLSNAAVSRMLDDIVSISPADARVVPLPVASVHGDSILSIEISRNVASVDKALPRVGLFAGLHANEAAGTYGLLKVAEQLLLSTDRDVTSLLQRVVVHIVPRVNIDAFDSAVFGECFGRAGSLNANDVDLFTDAANTEDLDSGMQPETKALMLWVQQQRFALTAYFGAGAYGVTWPFSQPPASWQKESNPSPEANLLQRLAEDFAAAFASYSPTLVPMYRGLSCHETDPEGRFTEVRACVRVLEGRGWPDWRQKEHMKQGTGNREQG